MPLATIAKPDLAPIRLFRLSAERRNPPRVKIAVGGRVMLEDKLEYGATTVDASIKAIGIKLDVSPRIGSRIIGYFDTIGRVEGIVERVGPEGVIIEMVTTARKRDKLAGQLTWLANRDVLNLPEDRRHDRLIPKDPRVEVRRVASPLDTPISGHMIDISRSGAGVSVSGGFAKGEEIILGTTPARVVRVFDGGVAVEFKGPVPEALFSTNLRL